MRKVSMTARDELVNALARRYAIGSRQEKTRVLDEFVAITGFHRKHAMRLLRSGPSVRIRRPGTPDGFTVMRSARHWWCFGRPRIEFAANGLRR